jgi:hypothetical protein
VPFITRPTGSVVIVHEIKSLSFAVAGAGADLEPPMFRNQYLVRSSFAELQSNVAHAIRANKISAERIPFLLASIY